MKRLLAQKGAVAVRERSVMVMSQKGKLTFIQIKFIMKL
jgi:hypothetical protein